MSSYQDHAVRQDTMRSFLNAKMDEGTPVRDHCLKMISFFNVLKVFGAKIDIGYNPPFLAQSKRKGLEHIGVLR
jgi:hypothetical protein